MQKNYFILLLFTILCWNCKDKNNTTPINQTNRNKVTFKIDERIEILRIGFNLAVQDYIDKEMLPCKTTYADKINTHFAAFKKHPFIKYIDDLPNIAFDFPTIGLMLKNNGSFEFNDVYAEELRGLGLTTEEMKTLQPLMVDFYKKSNFESFFKENEAYYKKAIGNIENQVNDENLFGYVSDFFQSKQHDLDFVVFVELTNSSNNKAISFYDNYNPKKRATLLANVCEANDSISSTNEILELDANRRTILYHESSHLFTDKLFNTYVGELSQYESLCENCNESQLRDYIDHLIIYPLQELMSYRQFGKDNGHNFYLNKCTDVRKAIYTKLTEYQPENGIPFEETYKQCIALIKQAALVN